MKKQRNPFILIGILLILLSIGVVAFFRIYAEKARIAATATAAQIEAMLPSKTTGIPGDYREAEMPVLEFDGTDYVAMLSIPGYGLNFPIADQWNNTPLLPCPARFYGSIYDGTMIIGGNDQPGQFDFFHRMEPGDSIRITDMMGSEFSYTIDRIDRSKSADYEKLSAGGYPLTLFVRSAYSTEYILVRCTTKF